MSLEDKLDFSQLRKVGKLTRAHGIRGELFITIFSGEAAWLDQLEQVILTKEKIEDPLVFTIERARFHKNGLIIKTKEINDRNRVEELRGRVFYVPDEFFVSEEGEMIYLSELEGFEVQNPQGQALGKIIGFSENKRQDILRLKTPLGIFEIPLVEEFIQDKNFEEKWIKMDLPYGLLGEDDQADDQNKEGDSDETEGTKA